MRIDWRVHIREKSEWSEEQAQTQERFGDRIGYARIAAQEARSNKCANEEPLERIAVFCRNGPQEKDQAACNYEGADSHDGMSAFQVFENRECVVLFHFEPPLSQFRTRATNLDKLLAAKKIAIPAAANGAHCKYVCAV